MRNILLVAICCLSTILLHSYTYLGVSNYGDEVEGISARAMGMGNTQMNNSQFSESLFYNPANIVWADKKEVGFSFSLYIPGERVIPDNNWSSETGCSYYNFQSISEISNFSFIYPFGNIGVGIGYFPLYDFHYKNGTDIYSGDTLTGRWDLKSEGTIFAYAPSFAFKSRHNFSLGLGFLIANGKRSIESSIVSYSPYTVTKTTGDFKSSGSGINVSFMYRGDNYALSLLYRSSLELNYKADGYEGKYKFPGIYGLGFSYTHTGIYEASLSLEILHKKWSDFRDKTEKIDGKEVNQEQDPHYPDTTEIHIGVEHFAGNIIIRYGLSFVPCYQSSAYEKVEFSVGTGFGITDNLMLDIAFSYGKMNYLGTYSIIEDYYNWRTDLIERHFLLSTVWKF